MPQSSPTLVSEMSISHHATGTDFQSVWLQFSHCLAAAKMLTAKSCFCVAVLLLLCRFFPFSLLSLSLCPACPVFGLYSCTRIALCASYLHFMRLQGHLMLLSFFTPDQIMCSTWPVYNTYKLKLTLCNAAE